MKKRHICPNCGRAFYGRAMSGHARWCRPNGEIKLSVNRDAMRKQATALRKEGERLARMADLLEEVASLSHGRAE